MACADNPRGQPIAQEKRLYILDVLALVEFVERLR